MLGSSSATTIGLTACAIGLLAACGADVVIQSGGAGGSGASTSTSTTPTGTTTGTSTTATTVTTSTTSGGGGAGAGIASLCAEFCAVSAACGQDPNCEAECITQASPECAAVYTAFLNCLLDAFDPSICELPGQCQAVMNQWAMCEGEPPPPPPPPCGPQGCSGGSDGSCACTMECADMTYEASCAPQGQEIYCRCAINNSSVGNCTGGGPMSCDVQNGCCSYFFFWDEV